MELFRKGKIISIGKTYVIFETNNRGHIIYVARPREWEINKFLKMYIYKFKSEYQESYYGFSNFKERILFEDLIAVNGVGPKTAINILKEGFDVAIQYIGKGDVNNLTTFPHLGKKIASQIVFELKDKYENNLSNKKKPTVNMYEIKNSLKTLGFNPSQIDYALKNIKPDPIIENMIEQAIILIANAKFA